MTQAMVPFNPSSLDETMTLGKVLAQSGFFSDSREAAQAVVKVLAGAELGFGPVASMTGVNIIKGKVALSANLIAAAIKRSGRYNYRVRELTDQQCTIEFFEQGQSVGVSSFSMVDAKNAGLATGDNWRKFPRNMLFARAISNGAKWYCPDLSGGPLYTPDELGVVVDGETGEVLDAPSPRVIVEDRPKPAQPNGAPSPTSAAYEPEDGEDVWADWRNPDDAQEWAMTQGVFDHPAHAANAYAKVKRECAPTTSRAMWKCWYADVRRRIAERDAADKPASNDKPAADPDGWDDIDAHGVDLPQFS